MHNESRSELQTDDVQPPVTMKTYSIHKADNDNTRECGFRFVTTSAIPDDGSWNVTEQKALQAALDAGAVTEAGVYLVTEMPNTDDPDYDPQDYRARRFYGELLTITTTPRIEI